MQVIITKKKYIDKCTYYHIDYCVMGQSEELSQAIGKNNRVALGILDKGFANKSNQNEEVDIMAKKIHQQRKRETIIKRNSFLIFHKKKKKRNWEMELLNMKMVLQLVN